MKLDEVHFIIQQMKQAKYTPDEDTLVRLLNKYDIDYDVIHGSLYGLEHMLLSMDGRKLDELTGEISDTLGEFYASKK